MKGNGLLCVGAFNHDTVAIGTVPQSTIRRVADHSRYSTYGEMMIPDALAEEIVREVRSSSLAYSQQLGGSAFNVARVLSAFAPQLRLGFWGVAGKVDGDWPHVSYLNAAGVEVHLVSLSETPPAASIAFSADADRTIFTSRGANDEAAGELERQRAKLVQYFSSFEIIHITSFLDPIMPSVLASAMKQALEINPTLVISIDPGHAWASEPTGGVEALLGMTSLLHLNTQEFANLGGRVANEVEDPVAARIRNMLRPDADRWLVVRKHDSILIYIERSDGSVLRVEAHNDVLVPSSAVVDATGAGDTFVAGMLLVLGSPVLQLALGAKLGTALGAAKIKQQGPLSRDPAKSFMRSEVALAFAAGHGRGGGWLRRCCHGRPGAAS